jgi:hypothetical protein
MVFGAWAADHPTVNHHDQGLLSTPNGTLYAFHFVLASESELLEGGDSECPVMAGNDLLRRTTQGPQ